MNKIDTLVAYLFAIQAFAKDIHYSASGEAFYSKHLLADEIYKGIDEQIDALIETSCLALKKEPLLISNYWLRASEHIPEINLYNDFENLSILVVKILQFITELGKENITAGERSLLDSIAQDLQRKLGLITRQVG